MVRHKPGSVPFAGRGHSSRIRLAADLKQPTRKGSARDTPRSPAKGSDLPYLAFLRAGFAMSAYTTLRSLRRIRRSPFRRRRTSLGHPRERWALTLRLRGLSALRRIRRSLLERRRTPFHPCLAFAFGGLVSVALSRPDRSRGRGAGVTRRPVPWSPDFPLRTDVIRSGPDAPSAYYHNLTGRAEIHYGCQSPVAGHPLHRFLGTGNRGLRRS